MKNYTISFQNMRTVREVNDHLRHINGRLRDGIYSWAELEFAMKHKESLLKELNDIINSKHNMPTKTPPAKSKKALAKKKVATKKKVVSKKK